MLDLISYPVNWLASLTHSLKKTGKYDTVSTD